MSASVHVLVRASPRQTLVRARAPRKCCSPFHTTLLNRHSTPEFDSQKRPLPPPPDIINDEEEYEVEEIRGHRKRG
jgi:hypothetical protein